MGVATMVRRFTTALPRLAHDDPTTYINLPSLEQSALNDANGTLHTGDPAAYWHAVAM